MPHVLLRYDLRCPAFGCDRKTLYAAALEQASWADEKGLDAIQLSEHHGSDDGYLPSPMILAAAMAARTRRIRLRFSLITLPFHNPLRVAEDLAVLDILSGGRVEVIFGGGYVPAEFALFDVDPKQRGQRVEEGVSAIKAAWRGEPFEYRGRTVRITPTPLQQPRPSIWLGGSSKVAARRAAHIADGFYTDNPELYEAYRQEGIALGRDPGPWGKLGSGFLHVTHTPDADWAHIAPHALHEFNSYGRWFHAASGNTAPYQPITDAALLRSMGHYPVLTPAQAIDYARQQGANGNVCLHPLVAGLDPALGWASLRLFAEAVLPVIRQPDFHTGVSP